MLNITSNIYLKKQKQKKQFTIYYRSTLMKIHLCTNVIKKVFLLIIPNTKSRYSIHMSDYQVTMYSDIF